MNQQPFVPIGLPHDAHIGDAVDERVGFHLLDALDSLDAVYKSAAFFADLAAEASIADYTLTRCLESVHCEQGALYLQRDGSLLLASDRQGAAALLRRDELATGARMARTTLLQGGQAAAVLEADAPPRSVLITPILVGARGLGTVVLIAAEATTFSTADAKLVAAVASQAAIALARAHYHHEAEIERQTLSLVVQNHPDGLVVVDAHGKTTLCNPIAREFLGGDDVMARLVDADPACQPETLANDQGEREVTLPHGDQQRAVKLRWRKIRDGGGNLANVILTLRDLTRQRREERLKRNFLSLLSHKFRTPLTALVCALQMMDGASSEDRALFTSEMQGRADDLAGLIDRLFGFTELLEGSWSTSGTTDLAVLRDELTTHYRTQAAKSPHELVWAIADDVRLVPVPPARLRVAMQNLIDNAIKFSGTERPWVRVSARRCQHGIEIAVEDRGPGIPHAERAELFEAFHQVDTEFTGAVPGAGIGLAIVREIAVRLGGRLELRDAEPHGAVFTLTFPLPSAAPQP